ncbi:hypothetical protein IF1G_07990 [Cordyceps javanica]|uniref:Uncharacterized protein n=1 Tax=Cordyceps javanica TaxID=43265 RepID=A0A545VU60_9HYPO|nr:hypothetical protein IF1G_07990 [Cordyceps javanica]TQW05246.1 hypothetical protein IF2G_07183 [Cordyceps javanica]
MGNAPSSEEVRIPRRRRLSKPHAMGGRVHIAGEYDYDGAPTTPLSGAYHRLGDAIPTVPSFALVQHQSISGIQRAKNIPALSHRLSAATTSYKSRPSRHSTDAFHPLRSAPVSGSARATSIKEDDALGNDADSKRIDELYFSSPPDLSSSSSTESWRTLSTDSNTSRELPLYIPYRRRSQRIPGLATRPSDEEIHRPNLPASPLCRPPSPSLQDEGDPVSPIHAPARDQETNHLGNSSEVAYKQLGSIKFGSLRITNGSPLSMRRVEVSVDDSSDRHGNMQDSRTSSGVETNSHLVLTPASRLIERADHSTSIGLLDSTNLYSSLEEPLINMHVSETVRGRQGRISSETQRASIETLRRRISSYIEVIDDEQLKLIQRPRSTLVTADDSSSVYSDNVIPLIISNDILPPHEQTHSDNSNGPHLSFQTFRNLIRQKKVKSYLQANNKAAVSEEPSHQRSASEQDTFTNATSRSPIKSRRKLSKTNNEAAPPPLPSFSNAEATASWPLPMQTSNQSTGRWKKGHASSKSDGQVPRMRSLRYEEAPVPHHQRHGEHAPRDRSEAYQTTSEHVPILLDRKRANPRAHVNFEGDVAKRKDRLARVEQIRRSQTTEFKPLPLPKPELPQRRTPVRVPVPTPTGSRIRSSSHENPRESRDRQNTHTPMPSSHARSHTIPLVAQRYVPERRDEDLEYYDGLPLPYTEFDSPYVSPLSDGGEELWPLTSDQPLSQTETAALPRQFRPSEVSPIRHAKSMPSINSRGNERALRTPAPISAHSRRAQELAETWERQQQEQKQRRRKQQQQQQQQQQQPLIPSLEQLRLLSFQENAPSSRPTTASAIDEYYSSPDLFVDRDESLPPIVYRNGTRRGSEVSARLWRPPYRVLHSYYSPAYRNAPIWG